MRTNIATVSGEYFDYVDMDSNKVELIDVATGLSNECRFASQLRDHYSVAQHSVLVARLLQLEFEELNQATILYGLFHDASEAFCKDVPTPLKRLLPDYYEIEARVQTWLCQRFGVLTDEVNMKAVQTADLMALDIEKRYFVGDGAWHEWAALQGLPQRRVVWHLDPVAPRAARKLWLDEWAAVRGGVSHYYNPGWTEGVTC